MTIRIYTDERTSVEEAEEKAAGIMAWCLIGFMAASIGIGCVIAWFV